MSLEGARGKIWRTEAIFPRKARSEIVTSKAPPLDVTKRGGIFDTDFELRELKNRVPPLPPTSQMS